MSAAKFYEERDRRTKQMGVVEDAANRRVRIRCGSDVVGNRHAQIALLALINMVSRVHRHIALSVADAPLLAKSLLPSNSLREALRATALAIDPFLNLQIDEQPAEGLSIQVDDGPSWFLGADKARGLLSETCQGFSSAEASVLGAAMSSCLGAWSVCRLSLNRPVTSARISAWDGSEGDDAMPGLPIGQVDLGSVLLIGAGAVGSALAYWVRELDIVGKWLVVDGDDVALHNINRMLCAIAADAGWPGGMPAKKAELLGRVLSGESDLRWYDEWISANPHARPDIVLPLANGRYVRRLVGQRFEPVILHATTSLNWEAQLHRHIAGKDDCIECRMREHESKEPSQFTCGTGTVPNPDGTSTDAALPFLSGAAGLLLASALCRLGIGNLATDEENFSSLHFDTNNRLSQRSCWECKDDCANIVSVDVRREIASGSRWASLLSV
jgi:hypothetical protein